MIIKAVTTDYVKMQHSQKIAKVDSYEQGMVWNGNFGMNVEDATYQNGMEDNLPYFHTNSILDFAHGIYRKIYIHG